MFLEKQHSDDHCFRKSSITIKGRQHYREKQHKATNEIASPDLVGIAMTELTEEKKHNGKNLKPPPHSQIHILSHMPMSLHPYS